MKNTQIMCEYLTAMLHQLFSRVHLHKVSAHSSWLLRFVVTQWTVIALV